MSVNLGQKERMLLEDQRQHEQLCIQKYSRYAEQTQDPQLKQLFQSIASSEKQHLNTINQILSGQVPTMNQGGQAQNQGASMQANLGVGQGAAQSYGQAAGQTMSYTNQDDSQLCTDMLVTEKYISGAYDTTIFECRDNNLRQALNHIQKEEQQHGQRIFDYMQSNGMYNVQ